MASKPSERLILRLTETEPGRWNASSGGHQWPISPEWPPNSQLLEIAWLAEDSKLSPTLGDYASVAMARADKLGARLWESLVRSAPAAAVRALENSSIDLRIACSNPLRIAALGLLRDAHGIPL